MSFRNRNLKIGAVNLQVNNVNLEAVAVSNSGYPVTGLPEVAFAGKSNVGKSSLINTMIMRKALARTSGSPGKTRTINFYNVENKLYFVDLPGYGYAKVSKTEKEKWGAMIEKYLLKRDTLKAVVLLVDIRNTPGENDILMYNWLKHYFEIVVIALTKTDKINRSQIKKHTQTVVNTLNADDKDIVIQFSSETKAGRQELWDVILESCEIYDI